MKVGRRGFLFGAALAAALGAAPALKAEAKSLSDLLRADKTAERADPMHEDMNYFANILFPQFIIADYERNIHSSKANEEKFRFHPHPKREPETFEYWQRRHEELAAEAHKFDDAFDIEVFNDTQKAVHRMEEEGYVYRCFPSLVGDGNSYILGKISDKKDIRENLLSKEKHTVIFYDEIVPAFENYTRLFKIFSRNDIANNVILMDNTAINSYSRYIFNLGDKLESNPGNFHDFHSMMIIREYRDAGSADNIAKRLKKAVVYHEISHPPEESESARGELIAQLTQIYHQPFLTLAQLAGSSSYDGRDDQIYKNVADTIFDMFERAGYSREELMKMSKTDIKIATNRIIKTVTSNDN